MLLCRWNSTSPTGSVKKSDNSYFVVHVPIACVLISLGYWENYAQVTYSSNRAVVFIQTRIAELRKHNAKIYLLMSPLKIALLFAFNYLLLPRHVQSQFVNVGRRFNFTQLPAASSLVVDPLRHDLFFGGTGSGSAGYLVPFVVHVVSSCMCFVTARIACKVLMQGLGFALPLVFSTPVTFLVLLVASYKAQFEHITIFRGVLANFFYWDGFRANSVVLTICMGFLVYWLSHMWIVQHIWSPKLERLAKNERIFTRPLYESTMLDQCLMLNRRRLDEITLADADLDESSAGAANSASSRTANGKNLQQFATLTVVP